MINDESSDYSEADYNKILRLFRAKETESISINE